MRNMRKTTLFVGIVAGIAIALLAGLGTSTQTASADAGPHVDTGTDSTPDKCASCHRIHTGQNEYLLKEAGSETDFCYSCHGTGGPGSDLAAQEGTLYGGAGDPYGDPYGGKTELATVGLRAGGFDAARIDTTDPSAGYGSAAIGVLATTETVVSNHAIDGTAGTTWGSGPIGSGAGEPSVTLGCGSCHNPHGNGQYRILRPVPVGAPGAGYAIPDTYPKAAADYATPDYLNMYFGGVAPANPIVDDRTPGVSILMDTSAWCAQCHTRYLAEHHAADPADASREDSGDPIFTYRHTSSGYGYSSYRDPAGFKFNNRACITCHASHGSNASMPGPASSSVEWPDGSVVNPPNDLERASLLKMDNRGICLKCHNE